MIERLEQVSGRAVSRETLLLLERYAELLQDEATRQNLVSRSTLGALWERHIVDSAQLLRFVPSGGGGWADIGSGAGLPGVVIAILGDAPVTLIEPRRLRAEFLQRVIDALGLDERASVADSKVEKVGGSFDVITARAVASVERLLTISTHLSTRKTLWVMPKGQSAQYELAEARRSWHCEAEIVPSCTDPQAEILLLRNVRRRGGR